MARLQDFPAVTPSAANDKLLIVQAAGQGNATIKAVGDAIFGAEDAGALPLGINPPTGSTGKAIAENASDISTLQSNKVNKTPTAFSITPATGINIQYQRCCAFGELKFISLYFSASSSATAKIGTVPSDYKAKGSTFFPVCRSSGSSTYAYLATNSTSLQGDGTIAAGNYMINGFYW